MHIFYVDDSGGDGITTFSALGVPAHCWNEGLGNWLAWRRHLEAIHPVPIHRRLHATDWVAGRGRPSERPTGEISQSRPARWREYVAALDAIAALPELQILTVGQAGSDRRATYRILMRWIDDLLREKGEQGLVIVDGDSNELRTMHRELDLSSRAIASFVIAADGSAYAGWARESERVAPGRPF